MAGGLLSGYLRRRRVDLTRYFVSSGLLRGAVLDIGCWKAELLTYLPEGTRYVGWDIEEEFIRRNRELFPQHRFEVVDLEKDRFPKIQKVDSVILTAVIEHIANTDNFFAQLPKVLKKGGNCLITTPTPIGDRLHGWGATVGLVSKEAAHEHVSIYNRKRMLAECRKHGLVLKRHKRFEFGLNQYFVVGVAA